MDPELAELHGDAKRAQEIAANRAAARPNDTDAQAELWRAEQALEELENRLRDEDAIVEFTFRSIGRAAYDALANAHQPTALQRAQAKALGMGEIMWNTETFPPALVAASLVEPKLSAEEVESIWRDDNWNQAELNALLQAAVEVNGTRRTVELGKGSSKTRSSGPNSTTAASEESPTASS